MLPAPRTTGHPSETALSEACQKRLRAMGGACLKTHGSAAQMAGTPDLLCCLAGRFVAVELKQPGKVPTALQMKRLRTWAEAGALAGWVTTEAEFVGLLELAGAPPVVRVFGPNDVAPAVAGASAGAAG